MCRGTKTGGSTGEEPAAPVSTGTQLERLPNPRRGANQHLCKRRHLHRAGRQAWER